MSDDDVDPTILASRIHTPGCIWSYSFEATDQLGVLHEDDAEAYDLLMAMTRRARLTGIPPAENNNVEGARHPTHRVPVGRLVLDLPDHNFTKERPMPWAGELYAESSDGQTLYRLYFIERRATPEGVTIEIVGSGVGQKPANDDGYDPTSQTAEIKDAMHSGIERCLNTKTTWRRWNAA
ncbi:hypothetical protein PP488_gp43 [Gordonia phage Agueybana]|uniref:Uncharacterized protein n=1 Tax=Gordonia phage Agueybana TaxID=2859634 RepID=A0AC61NL62_9CAUD|nr:hypothetical protein PP488_gp43 [Gordonia phage Agueybana]QYC54601.1 hypothetical protein SEA_AGUEYBANA_43 [Gordonia phage Agueybana]